MLLDVLPFRSQTDGVWKYGRYEILRVSRGLNTAAGWYLLTHGLASLGGYHTLLDAVKAATTHANGTT